MSLDDIYALTHIDYWFLEQIREIIEFEQRLSQSNRPVSRINALRARSLCEAKELGFSDHRIAQLTGYDLTRCIDGEKRSRGNRAAAQLTYKRVDTCAAEFEAKTPYLYSTYGTECEARPTDRRKVMILGGGPNRIGQGIEFDYCCVHAAMALARRRHRNDHGQLQSRNGEHGL